MAELVPAKALGQGPLEQQTPRDHLEFNARLAVAGFAIAQPNWDGVVLLPGDPSYWVHLSAGEVVSFRAFLTQRMAMALEGGGRPDLTALNDSMARPERIAGDLRIAELGNDRDAILGHLMGAELAAARIYWLGQQVILLGDGDLADGYGKALEAQGVPVTRGERAACEEAAQAALNAGR